ncbi:MAG: adenylyltransferase/cytidyltransferase family protein, partial [Oscillospiraceae bacterium]|nr:adenylyltransferase/cytidyltransferase family protein [Oscillospiraceae bacterium]
MKTAVYPGSFDPITLGHLDIIQRCANVFDKVVVVITNNYLKSSSYIFSAQERAQLVRKSTGHIENVRVEIYEGLLADYVRDQK